MQPAAIVLALLSTMAALGEATTTNCTKCSFTNSKYCCIKKDYMGYDLCVCNSKRGDGDYILKGNVASRQVTSIK